MARAFVAKQVYNFQTTSALIDRLKIDRTLRMICGWRHCNKIPSESKFSRVFKEIRTECNTSIKQNSKANRHKWTGGKLHLSVIDGDIPITAI